MSYEFSVDQLIAISEQLDVVFAEPPYPAQIKGMHHADYDPDLDDYEYLQRLY